ncbi:hypothetical protein SEA_NERGAL_70 [Mycobacterium Phage Nergal]|nr:hypothetical protein SEA_NERGAL_70 [Mycobacterium Phage Nergal]
MTAGLTALNARKARIAAALRKSHFLTPEQADLAAECAIGRGVSVRQAEAKCPSLAARSHLAAAIKLARAATADVRC